MGMADTATEGSSLPILEAIRWMENSMNTRFENLETALTGIKSILAANSSCITNLEEAQEDHEVRLADLEKVCGELSRVNSSEPN